MTYQNVRTGLDLRVTLRPNVRTSSEWIYPLLDEYLDHIENSRELKARAEAMREQFLQREGEWLDTGEPVGDLVVTPRFLEGELKGEYRLQKLALACVNYFGHFLPPSNNMMLQGPGNGLVVLDIDLKGLGKQIPEPYLELIEEDLIEYFSHHLCTVFMYQSTSAHGYHIGFLTDAQTPEQYRAVFKQLVRDLQQNCHKVAELVDLGVGDHTRCFFTNHSSYVLRKAPEAIYRTNMAEAKRLEQQELQLVQGEQTPYDEFPYQEDFRLFLAFQGRGEGVFFDDRKDWITMLYALKATYPPCYLTRQEYWFNALSELSPKFDPPKDIDTFQDILNRETTQSSGVDFIIKHLAGGEDITRYPTYKRQDVEAYFDALKEMDKADSTDTNVLEVEQYLNEIKDALPLKENIIIEAPPGTGKSTLVLEHATQKRVILLPTLILLQDLQKRVPQGVSLQVVKQDVQPDDIVEAEVILSTYEGLKKILESKVDLRKYTLILDESHNLFVSASPSFRFTSLNRICSAFYRFHNVVLLSGTWIPFSFTNRQFQHYCVQKRNAEGPVLELVSTPNPLNSLAEEILQEPGKQIALVNNREENRRLERLIKAYRENAVVTVMNRDTKGDEAVRERLDYNCLQQGETLVGTQMIVEGISFNDADIKAIRFYQNLLPEHIIQLSYRARASEARPTIKYYHSRESFKLSPLADYNYAYERAKERYAVLKPDLLSREAIQDSQVMIYFEKPKGPRSSKVYTPYISGGSGHLPVQINDLLLGYYALRDVSTALNGDLFCLLVHLRRRDFRFSFSTMGVSTIREDFKQLEEALQKEIIRDKLPEVAQLSYEQLDHNPKDYIYRAWCLLQCVKVDYLMTMSAGKRVSIITDKKEFQVLVDKALGHVLLQGMTYSILEQFASKEFRRLATRVLTRFEEIPSEEGRYFNDAYVDTIQQWNLTTKEADRVLKKHFEKSATRVTTINGESKRYFTLTPKSQDFENYLKRSELMQYGSSPF